jgi:hypothetical protein
VRRETTGTSEEYPPAVRSDGVEHPRRALAVLGDIADGEVDCVVVSKEVVPFVLREV